MKSHVELKILPHGRDLYQDDSLLPRPATPGSAGVDLVAAETVILKPGQCLPVKTGLAMSIQHPSICAIVLPRSGLGGKKGLVLGNLVGLIDSDYQGELLCYAWNRNETEAGVTLVIERGQRFAQMMFLPFYQPNFNLVEEFSSTTLRGENGFGSTGT